jgi:hypothetical protein
MSVTVCAEVSVGALAIAALVHQSHVDEAMAGGTAFGTQQLTVEQMVAGERRAMATCADDTIRVQSALK